MSRDMPDTISTQACAVSSDSMSLDDCAVAAASAPAAMSNDCAVPAAAVSNTCTVISAATVSPATVASASMSAAPTMSATTVAAPTMSTAVSPATVSAAAPAPTGICFEYEKRHYEEQRSGDASRGGQHRPCNVAGLGIPCRCRRTVGVLPRAKSF
jgi:hypothetical protein